MVASIICHGETLSAAAFEGRIARACTVFEGLGLGEDDTLAILMRNDTPFLEAQIACRRLGVYAVPINWHFTPEEIVYILQDCGAKAILAHADLLRPLLPALPGAVIPLGVATNSAIGEAYGLDEGACTLPEGIADYEREREMAVPWAGESRAARHTLNYTSGTTGRPKGVKRLPLTPAGAAHMAKQSAWAFGIDAATRTLVTAPLYHSGPNHQGLNAALRAELVVLEPRFDAERMLALIAEHELNHLYAAPIMFVRLLRLAEEVRARYDLSTLRYVVHGGSPCPIEVRRQMIAWWGPVVHEAYAGGETGLITVGRAEDFMAKPGTVGKLLPGTRGAVYGPDGAVLGPNEVGALYFRTDLLPDFVYTGDRDDERARIERDGLISLGDVGYFDEDGYLFICDRVKDMIISGGVNIYPAEIEAVLITMPGVRDCAVFGIPDSEYGEAVAAAVERRDTAEGTALTEATVRDWLAGNIARFKVPKLVTFHDALPREDTGKIFKRKLRAPYWEDAGRVI